MTIEIKNEINPVGEAKIDSAVNNYVAIMSAAWDKDGDKIPWWKFWKRKSLVRITQFLLAALDDLVAYVDQLDLSGMDKKATVLVAISFLYDYVVKEALPIWAKPFAGRIKTYIINTMISATIDWIVEKYRNGIWVKKQDAGQMTALWAKEASMLLIHH